jgi:hypothetical protein
VRRIAPLSIGWATASLILPTKLAANCFSSSAYLTA